MKRREFLGTVAAGITARMHGPIDHRAKTAASSVKMRAAHVEHWMARCRQFDSNARYVPAAQAEQEFALPPGTLAKKAGLS